MITTQHHIKNRRGFTLLEMLMVMAVISVIATMSVVVMWGVAEQAKEEGTNATIRKVNGLLEARIESFERAFDRGGSFQNKYIDAAEAILQQGKIYGVRPEVITILAKKIAFRHNFPQRHEDLLRLGFKVDGVTPTTDFADTNNDGIITLIAPDPDEVKPINDRVIDSSDFNFNRIADVVAVTATDTSLLPTADAWVTDLTVSSELMYWFLIKSGNFGSAGIAADRFSEAEVADTDNDGLLEFVDAWGNPLRFYRWPTRMIDYDAPVLFQPVLEDLITDNTDVDPTPLDDDGDVSTVEDTDVQREIFVDERKYANILIKGLPPAPTSLPNGAIPRDMLLTDPDDPIGRLYAEMERLNGLDGKPALASEYNAVWYHTPETYHTPLIMSAGSDEELGLFEPSDTVNGGHLASVRDTGDLTPLLDNLTNRNRRAGGRR